MPVWVLVLTVLGQLPLGPWSPLGKVLLLTCVLTGRLLLIVRAGVTLILGKLASTLR